MIVSMKVHQNIKDIIISNYSKKAYRTSNYHDCS